MLGILRKNDNERWEIFDGDGRRWEITSGDVIEVLVGEIWIRTRVEHNGSDYYPVVAGISFYKGMPARTFD